MSQKANFHLFKERITKTHKKALIKELSDAIDSGADTLKEVLFGTNTPTKYAGTFQYGQHNRCAGLKENSFTEKRLCKCMYFRNGGHPKSCDKCDFQDRFYIVGDYAIDEYEVPAYYDGAGIGEIDLIINGDGVKYATEVKPYKNNSETLLRMIAEIMTYTEGYSEYKKAIAFFEKDRDDGSTKGEQTAQQKEYEDADPDLLALMKKADITVFRFEEVGHKEYRICKL